MNVDFLLDILDQNIDNNGDLSVFQYLKNLCDGINRSMAGITNLEPIIKNDKFVTIIEQNTPKGYDNIIPKKTGKKKSVDFELIGYSKDKSNFVKDFKFVTKITPDLGNIISIGAAAAGSNTKSIEALPFSKWNKGLKNIYQSKLTTNKPNLTKEQKEEIKKANIRKDFINNATLASKSSHSKTVYIIWRYQGKRYDFSSLIFDELTAGESSKAYHQTDFRSKKGYAGEMAKYWDTYSELREKVLDVVRKNIELEKIDSSLQAKNTSTAYLTHLAKAFGGNSQEGTLKEGTSTATYDIIPIRNARFWEINNDFINNGISLFKRYISDKQKIDYIEEEVVSNSVGFIPLNFQMTVEGLSGVKIYNKLNIDQRFLPKNYPNSLSFITMKVNHSITNNYWDTNYECFSIPKSTKTPTGKVSTSTTSIKLENEPTKGAPRTTVAGSGGKRFSVLKPNTRSGLLYETINPLTNTPITEDNKPVKTQVVIHHTAGLLGIEGQIKDWRDRPQGSCVSTQYIIDRDGKYEKLFEDRYWSQHLGTGEAQDIPESQTIGIELVSIGPLEKVGWGGDKYKSVVGDYIKTISGWGGVSTAQGVDPRNNSAYLTQDTTYRRYRYWQSYTYDQLMTLKKILLEIFHDYPNITPPPVGSGKVSELKVQGKIVGTYKTFKKYWNTSLKKDVNEKIEAKSFLRRMFPPGEEGKVEVEQGFKEPGVYSHSSYESNKSDVAPLKELIYTLAVVGYEAELNKTKPKGKTGYEY
jgi:N-acetyl-anhydromuramyl-L-alanine amidase AmpD